mmetsp:Transcript_15438/g.22752  ORF Transcript_15438/g.22752 Transcript_15438/m.22752 type:complete len:151 (-) Transcript_15438:114-566(-)
MMGSRGVQRLGFCISKKNAQNGELETYSVTWQVRVPPSCHPTSWADAVKRLASPELVFATTINLGTVARERDGHQGRLGLVAKLHLKTQTEKEPATRQAHNKEARARTRGCCPLPKRLSQYYKIIQSSKKSSGNQTSDDWPASLFLSILL